MTLLLTLLTAMWVGTNAQDQPAEFKVKQFTFSMLASTPSNPFPPEHDGEANYLQGTKHLYGAGIPLDFSQARTFLERSAQSGHPGGMSHLALMLDFGLGGEKDPARAVLLHNFASRAGQHVSTMILGFKYSRHPHTQCGTLSS